MILTACNGRGPVGVAPAATVDGHAISFEQVERLANAQVAYIRAAGKAQGSQVDPSRLAAVLARFQGENRYTLGTSGAAQALTMLIDTRLMARLVNESGAKVTASDRSDARSALDQQIAQSGVKITKAMQPLVDAQVEQEAMFRALERVHKDPSAREKELRKAFEANKSAFDRVCIQQLPTKDEADARKAMARISAGEDITTVAADLSLQAELAQPGNPQSCLAPSQLAGVFGNEALKAGAGDYLGPADAQGAWLIVRIWDVQKADFDQARAQLEQQVPDQATAAAQKALQKAFAETRVDVDPRLGTWNGASGSVNPPTDPLAGHGGS